MPAQSIHHINIRASKPLVADMKDFYQSVVGLTEGWRPPFSSTGHWLYLGQTPVLHLVEDGAVPDATGPRGPIVDHVAFSCTGLRDMEEVLMQRGIAFRRSEVPQTSLVQLMFRDPAGNGVELQFASGEA